MPEDTILPPQGVIAVRLSSVRMVYRDAAVKLVSLLVKELKKLFFNDLLVARVYGEYFFLELLQFLSSVPEFRVKGRDSQSIKHLLSDLYPCFARYACCMTKATSTDVYRFDCVTMTTTEGAVCGFRHG